MTDSCARFQQSHDVNTRMSCVQGSCDRQSLLGAGIKFHSNQRDVGLAGRNRKDVGCRCYSEYFEAWVSAERFRKELAVHAAAIRNQELSRRTKENEARPSQQQIDKTESVSTSQLAAASLLFCSMAVILEIERRRLPLSSTRATVTPAPGPGHVLSIDRRDLPSNGQRSGESHRGRKLRSAGA